MGMRQREGSAKRENGSRSANGTNYGEMLKRMKVRLYMIKRIPVDLVSKYWIYMIGILSVMKIIVPSGTTCSSNSDSMYVDGTTPSWNKFYKKLNSELAKEHAFI